MTQTQPAKTGATGNWGRWGDDDERGTLNLITPEAVLAATKVVKTGKVYNLGLPVARYGTPVFPYRGAPQRLTLTSQTDAEMNKAYGALDGVGSQRGRARGRRAQRHAHGRAVPRVRRRADVQRPLRGRSSRRTTARRTAASRSRADSRVGPWCSTSPATRASTGWSPAPTSPPTTSRLVAPRRASSSAPATSCSCAPAGSTCSRRSQGAEPPFEQPGLGASTIDYIADHDLAAVGCDNAAVEVIPFDGAVPRAAHRTAREARRHVPRAPRAVAARGRRREGVPARGGAAARHRRHRQPDQPDRDRLTCQEESDGRQRKTDQDRASRSTAPPTGIELIESGFMCVADDERRARAVAR